MSDIRSDSLKEKLSINYKMAALFTEGLHNIQGVVVTVVFIVSLYFPILDAPYAETASLMDQDAGVFLFSFLFLLLVLFYGGASKYLMRMVATTCIGMTVLFYYSYFITLDDYLNLGSLYHSSSGQKVILQYVAWGMLVNILACLALIRSAFFDDYDRSAKAI